jgi:type II secretory pathway component PulF
MHSFDWATLAQNGATISTAMVTSLKVQPNRNTHFGLQANGSHRRSFRSIKKFMGQLNKIFNNETVDLVHVSERIQAAFRS